MTWRRVLKIIQWIIGVVVGFMLIVSALLLIFKDDIKSYALEEINKHLNKRVHIGYIDVGIWNTFPDMSLDFENVLVHSKFDTLQTIDTAFYSETMRLRFNPMDFVNGDYNVHSIDINKSKVNLEIREDGKVNYDFLKSSEDSTKNSFNFELKEINLNDADFTYLNEATDQFYNTTFQNLLLSGSFNEKKFVMGAKTDFLIHDIKNKSLNLISDKQASCEISINMNHETSVFEIESADLNINKLPFQIRGKVSADSLDFYIGAKSLDLAKVATNFTIQELDVVQKVNGGGSVNIEAQIKGPISNTVSPAIDANFSIDNGTLSDKGFNLSNISAKGTYTNGVRNGVEQLYLSHLTFHTLNKDFTGNIRVTDFKKPRLKGEANGVIDLTAVHRLFGPFDLQKLSGNIQLDGDFDLRLNNPESDLKDIDIYDLRASLITNDIVANFENDMRIFNIPKGEITIRNQYAGFTDLAIYLGKSDILIDGSLNRIADYFKKEGSLIVDASVESNQLYLDDLSTSNPTVKRSRDWLLPADIQGKINMSLAKVNYSQHLYENIQGQLHFRKRAVHFPYLKGTSAEADIVGSLTVTEERPMYLVVNTNLSSDNVSFDPLFKEWNNFDQEVIKSDNIRGTATINLSFNGPFDLYEKTDLKNEFKVKADLKITDGALSNVSTFKEITKSLKNSSAKLMVSKNRIDSFEEKLLNLSFETFENVLRVENGILTIPKMSIKSNALDVNLKGTHTFENVIDYSFDFRFREIKGSSKNTEFGEVIDDGTGFKVYLKMFGNLDNPNFEWDKEAKKDAKKEQRQEAKEDFKSVMKTGFGVNKNDTTVKEYQKEEIETEKLYMEFEGDSTIEDEFDQDQKKRKKSNLQKQIDKWKKENKEEDSDVEFEIEE
ncbi:MAG: AsmA-like C-terminal region-containing protein [Brumimicrobium sp.]